MFPRQAAGAGRRTLSRSRYNHYNHRLEKYFRWRTLQSRRCFTVAAI